MINTNYLEQTISMSLGASHAHLHVCLTSFCPLQICFGVPNLNLPTEYATNSEQHSTRCLNKEKEKLFLKSISLWIVMN